MNKTLLLLQLIIFQSFISLGQEKKIWDETEAQKVAGFLASATTS